ncbi:MAG TPA: methyltransferase domain-containing protein [Ignavibacteriaceae bacterium]|nr:methyltransferase domain-containing protein [Ignavibacteriaceae bacterium]
MECCQADGLEEFMNKKLAARNLEKYRKNGPAKTTNLLLRGLMEEGVSGLTLLDIGGGVGVLQNELLRNGVAEVTSVDASSAYLEAARQEAIRQGHLDLIKQRHGDFVKAAEEIERADIVTLDRVICCYDDMESLVKLSASHALKLYGVVYPDNRWRNRILTIIENFFLLLTGSQFRIFNHPVENIEKIIREEGLERYFVQKTFIWRVHVYRRKS